LQADISIELSAHHLYPRVVCKALINERTALSDRLSETPRTLSEGVRQSMRHRIATLSELAAVAEAMSQQITQHPTSTTRQIPAQSGLAAVPPICKDTGK
jgi:hypothetical protein